jgi:hypothetical protein
VITVWRASVKNRAATDILVAPALRNTLLRQRAAFYWLLLIALLTVADAVASVAFAQNQLGMGPAIKGSIGFNLASLGGALACSVLVGVVKPAWWRRAMVALVILPTPILLATSHNLTAGFAACALVWPCVWLGRELAGRLCPGLGVLPAWSIGAALGFGLIAAWAFLLGTLGVLRPQFVWPVLVMVTLVLGVTARGRLVRDARACGDWLRRPIDRWQLLLLVLTGITLACVWLNLLGALTPEIRSDATRQRLASAAQFARTGSLAPSDPDLAVATAPALGEILYGAALTVGPVQTAKLVNFLAGLFCALTIFALGRRFGGDLAGGLAAFAFYTTTIVGYLSQTAYLDLFTTLFAVVAALCLTLHARPSWRTITLAGVCIGLGVAIKVHFGYVAVGLGVTALVLLARRHSWRQAVALLALLVTVAVATAAPWLVRSYVLTGAVPGLEYGTASLTRGDGEHPAELADLTDFGFGRSFMHLLAAPFTTTFLSYSFGGNQLYAPTLGGHIGYLLLALVPLLLLLRPRRTTLALGAGALVASVLWFYTAQYLRYGLPIFGFVCPLAGAAFARIRATGCQRTAIRAMHALVIVIALAGVGARMQMPDIAHRFAFGRQSRDAFLTEYLSLESSGSFPVITLLNAEPAATRVLADFDGARLYTPVRISNPSTTVDGLSFVGTDQAVLARLAQGGYSHILLDRRRWVVAGSDWDRVTAVNEDFLRRNTILLGGGEYSYLYRLLPPDQRGGKISWTRGAELLPNGGFETPGDKAPAGWTALGQPKQDGSGRFSHTGQGAVLLTGQAELAATVAVTPNTTYLFADATRSVQEYGMTNIRIEWHDPSGKVISVTEEHMPASPQVYHTFSMLATAPGNAATATIHVQAVRGDVWFDDLSLRVWAGGK